MGIPTPDNENVFLCFVLEVFATMFINIVRITLLIDRKRSRDISGFGIGCAYAVFVIVVAPFTGACLNPARSLGSLFVLDQVSSNGQFVMTLAPFVGCYLGALIYRKVLISEKLEDELEEL